MTRVEPPAGDLPVGRNEMKKIVRTELFFEIFRRKALSCMVQLAIMLVVLGVPAYFSAAFVAKAGLVRVPVLSSWLYEPAKPLRSVRPAQGVSNEVMLRAIGGRAKYEPITNLMTVSITEAELTTLAVSSLKGASSGSLPLAIRDLQIAVDSGVVEVFAVAPRDGYDTTMLLRFEPRIKEGSLELDLKELRIGAAKVPRSIAQFIASSVARIAIEALRGQLDATGTIAGVEVETGSLRFTIVPMDR